MAEPPSRRRARHDIVVEILKNARNGIKKTPLMYKASLSFTQIGQYLDALEKGSFIAEKSGIWKTTKKGLDVIEACEICLRLTEEV